MNFPHLFSLAEAQAALPELRMKLEELIGLKTELDRLGYDVYKHRYFGGMGPNGQKVFPAQMERLVVVLSEINGKGIEVKDLNRGLIDFPHKRVNGEVVFLCYLNGEEEISAWHSLEGGFSGRQPLSSL